MSIIKPFKGWRPPQELVSQVACRPYDVLNSEEARVEAAGLPYSLLHVIKPEIDLDKSVYLYDPKVYNTAKENFKKFQDDGVLVQDEKECLYVYAQIWQGRKQYGLVACAAVDDYMNNRIKKHEFTRPDKEEDRMKHVRVTNANMEPVFFAYRKVNEVDTVINEVIKKPATYDFTSVDGIGHQFWIIDDSNTINTLVGLFAKMPCTYIADGHHRTAAAALVGNEKRMQNPNHTGKEEYNFFLAVHFPDDQLQILDYNRVVTDLNGLSDEQFFSMLQENFIIEKIGKEAYRPVKQHNYGMYINGLWYSLSAKLNTFSTDPVGVLDVSVLTKLVLEPLGIVDQRTSKRIDFVGGMRGLKELEKRVDSGEMKVAFALHPVSMSQLFDIADNNLIMPPKVTWFEPKLRSGIVVHTLD